jgi:hypothetical protein
MNRLTPGDGHINTVDLVTMQRHFLRIALIPPGCRLTAADVNGDTVINTVDMVAVQRFFLGQSTGIANVGKFQFSPTSRAYPGVTNDQPNQDYDVLVFGDVATPFVASPGDAPDSPSGDSERNETTNPSENPVMEGTVSLPSIAAKRSATEFSAEVNTTAIDPADNFVAFQGDFTFDERVVTFASEPVEQAGLTETNWNVSGNVLPGNGPIRTFRISAYSNDFHPLSGSGTLFGLRMIKVSDAADSTQLLWGSPPNFIFIDGDLNTRKPAKVMDGSVSTGGISEW